MRVGCWWACRPWCRSRHGPGQSWPGRVVAVAPESRCAEPSFPCRSARAEPEARAALGHVRHSADRDRSRARAPRWCHATRWRPATALASTYRVRSGVVAAVPVTEGLSDESRVADSDRPQRRRADCRRCAQADGARDQGAGDSAVVPARSRRISRSRDQATVIMWISNTSIKRPVFATMVIVTFMVLGRGVDDPARRRPVSRRQLSLRQCHRGLSGRRAGGSRDAGHQADRGCGRGHQRRQAHRVELARVAGARRHRAAPRSGSAAGRGGGTREGRGHPRPAAEGGRGPHDSALRRRGAADHGLRRRARRRHPTSLVARSRTTSSRSSSRSTAWPRCRSTAARSARFR